MSKNPGRFEPTDLLAVQALSVKIPIGSALRLLGDDADKFNAALKKLPSGEFWEADRAIFEPGGDVPGAQASLFSSIA